MSLKIIQEDFPLVMGTYRTELKYYQSRLCSCVGENNGVPKIGCGCNQGFYYKQPTIIQGVKTNISSKYIKTSQGRIFDGGAQISIPKYYDKVEQEAHTTLSHGDIIVDPSKNRRDTDILIKGTRDFIFAFDVSKVISVYAKNTEYLQGIDFNIQQVDSAAGKLSHIVWEDEASITEGEYYTVEFICNEQYKVWEDAGTRRGTSDDNLPRKVVCVVRRYTATAEESNPIDNVNINEEF